MNLILIRRRVETHSERFCLGEARREITIKSLVMDGTVSANLMPIKTFLYEKLCAC